jgi:hypothetical protein
MPLGGSSKLGKVSVDGKPWIVETYPIGIAIKMVISDSVKSTAMPNPNLLIGFRDAIIHLRWRILKI